MRIQAGQRPGWLAGIVFMCLTLSLAACGASSTTTLSGGNTSVTGTVTSATGCPQPTQSITRSAATVVVKAGSTNQTITLQKGQTLEVQLAFGRRWAYFPAPLTSLTLQEPSGYGDVSVQSCIWRFTATQSGSNALTFDFSALCVTPTKDTCPQYEGQFRVNVTVQ